MTETKILAGGGAANRVLQYEFTAQCGPLRDFTLRLTDPDDPTTLWDYRLRASDFPQFRDSQQLLCDLPGWPDAFAALLKQVDDEPKIEAIIDAGSNVFEIRQRTVVRILVQLRLELTPATEGTLNEYLAGEVKRYKARIAELEQETQQLSEHARRVADSGSSEVARLREHWSQELEVQGQSLAAVREQAKAELEAAQARAEAELVRVKRAHAGEIDSVRGAADGRAADLQRRLDEVTAAKHQLEILSARQGERVAALESQVADKVGMIERLEADIARRESEATHQVEQVRALEAELATVRARQAALIEATRPAHASAPATAQQQLEVAREQLAAREDEIKALQARLAEAEPKARERDWLAQKSHDVVKKHQEDFQKLARMHDELKAVADERGKKLADAQREMAVTAEQLKRVAAAKDADVGVRDARIASLQTEVGELKAKLAEEGRTVTYLEKQLNDAKAAKAEEVAAAAARERRAPVKEIYDESLFSDVFTFI